MQELLSLAAIEPDDPRFGGKAAGLARLLRAGASVPEGFAVAAGTLAPREWSSELRERFESECRVLLGQDHGGRGGGREREEHRGGARERDQPRDGAGAETDIGGSSLAIRSSALVEDQRDRSFAGLFVTVLEVRSAAEALDAAERCVASGASERVLSYAGGAEPALAVGVVVQRLARARVAGTLFTRDPRGLDGALVIEAVPGLGEALVSGHAEPERWRLYRSGLGGWESRCERRPEQQRPEQPIPSAPASVLTAAEAELLATEASRLATELGEPLDLEWAIEIDSAAPTWLQARPITASVEPPRWTIERTVPDADDGPITVWSNWNVRETMPDPLHPLTWSLWRDIILPFLHDRFFGVPRDSPLFAEVAGLDRIQGRIYWNLNAALAIPALGSLLGATLHQVDARAGAVVADLVARGVLQPRRLRHAGRGAALASMVRMLRSSPRTLRALLPRAGLASLEAAAAEVARRPPIETLDARALLAELRLWESPEAGALRDGMQMLVVMLVVWVTADAMFAPYPDAQRLLAAGIRGNPTTEISLRLDGLIEAARPLAAAFAVERAPRELFDALAASAAGREWLELYRGFLDFCGQRGPREFDLAAPRWSDDPTMVIDLVRLGLVEQGTEGVGARLDRLERERAAAIDGAVRAAPLWKRPLLRRAAKSVANVLPMREAPKHYGLHVFQRMRHAALELGCRLEGAGVLATADDVFFLELAELENVAPSLDGGASGASATLTTSELARRIAQRRAELDDFTRRAPPDFLRSDGVPVDDGSQVPSLDGVLRGTGVSRGAASGVARVLDRPDPRAFAAGDVLVVRYADPGWTPLFPRAAALVMEVGGAMCHAAVVARELGIPAVFGVARATELLAGGARVAVDGSSGEVRILDPAVQAVQIL
jgi:pyruvate,water dikinase